MNLNIAPILELIVIDFNIFKYIFFNVVKCPRGRQYKDTCGNDCTCYEKTGAVLCNELRRCPQDTPAKIQVPSTANDILQKRVSMKLQEKQLNVLSKIVA